MQQQKHHLGPRLIKKVIAFSRTLLHGRPKVLPELQTAINSCRDMEELKTLLFSCGTLDEAAIQAFDRRIEQLEGTGKE